MNLILRNHVVQEEVRQLRIFFVGSAMYLSYRFGQLSHFHSDYAQGKKKKQIKIFQ